MLFLSLALKNARKLGKLAKFFLVVRELRKNSEIFPKNVTKTKELIVFRRRSSVAFDHSEPFIRGAERVATMRVLGVVVNSKLTMKDHLDHLLSSCASSIYALRMLRVHGLQDKQIHVVASMTTLASMLYASPAWWGFTTAQDRDRIER